VNFAEVYEIEGGRRLEVGAGLGWDLDVSGPEEGCSWPGPLVDEARPLAKCRMWYK
jgi:hypothetical protein